MTVKKTCSWLAAAAMSLAGASVWADSIPWGRVNYTDGTSAVLDAVDEEGEATLTNADFAPGKTPTNVHFLVNTTIGTIRLENLDLSFTGEGIVLSTSGKRSMFDLTGNNGEWKFSGLTFQGAGQMLDEFAPYDGGAIRVERGRFTLDGCVFSDFVTRFTGGAVSAMRLTASSTVTNCVFTDNSSHPINGYGGALYASTVGDASETASLRIADTRFEGNSAENGGAVCAFTVVYEDELPIPVAIDDKTVFQDNAAVYEGGAVITEGAVAVTGADTLFRANRAGLTGGAICLTGIVGDSTPVALDVSAATFADNSAGTNTTWGAGGAIAVLPPGCTLNLRDHALFTNNVASTGTGNDAAFGGAVYTAADVTNEFAKVAFVGNRVANSGGSWCYGGAVSAEPGCRTTIDTCVFDCGDSVFDKCYGNAVDFNGGEALILNTTMRRGCVEAVSSYQTALAVTNCVIVGNGLADGFDDLYLEDTTLSMAYTAYGDLGVTDAEACTGTNNLPGRTTAEVYDGDTLKLRGTGFNPAAGLGLAQTATDFDGVAYGSLPYGFSMGAYETPTERLLVVLDGTKVFDDTATSNGCVWTWSIYTNEVGEAEAQWSDLGEVRHAFAIDSWTFGSKNVGSYCSTNDAPNDIAATLLDKTAKVTWLRTVLDFLYTGVINKESDVAVVYAPQEYAWTGAAITPGAGGTGAVVVSNKVSNLILGPDEYEISWLDNVDPTDTAKLVVTCTNNYDFVQTNHFAITAYITEYFVDGALSNVATNGSLSASNVTAVISVPAGFCLDYQNSKTNDEVYVFGAGIEDPDDATSTRDVTTLQVRYEADVNGGVSGGGDGIPDKYQRKVLFATVNGYWNGTNEGRDRILWVTLTNTAQNAENPAQGVWDVNGKCELTAAVVPGVGEKPFDRFAKESEAAGEWNVQPVGSVVGATGGVGGSAFPIYFYSPASKENAGHGGTDPRSDLPLFMGKAVSGEPVDVGGLRNTLAITHFALDENGEAVGAVEAQVVNTLNHSPLARMALENTAIEIWGAVTLDGEWFKVYDAQTDSDGVWTVKRTRSTRTVSVARTQTGERTAAWSVDGVGQPKFFRVRIPE